MKNNRRIKRITPVRSQSFHSFACPVGGQLPVRWGGDEFMVMLEDLAQAADAEQVAEKILVRFTMPLVSDQRESFVSLSFGIATFPAACCDIDGCRPTLNSRLPKAF